MKRARLVDAGIAILVIGFTAAAIIYLLADEPRGEVEFANPRTYENQIERFGGKATLYAVRFNEWLSTWLHGRPLAITIAVSSLPISLLLFWIARRNATIHSQKDNVT